MTEAGTVMALWLYAIMGKNLDMTMNYYGDTVDYFQAGEVPKSRGRGAYKKAFDKYDTIQFAITKFYEANLNPDGTVELIFDKKWNFSGDEPSSGMVKELLLLQRFGNDLKIVKIQDLQVY